MNQQYVWLLAVIALACGFAANAQVPVKSVSDLIALAKWGPVVKAAGAKPG